MINNSYPRQNGTQAGDLAVVDIDVYGFKDIIAIGVCFNKNDNISAVMSGDIASLDIDLDGDIDIVVAGNDLPSGRSIDFF